MKKISSWLLILLVAVNAVSALPLYEDGGASAAGASLCAGIDLCSPIAAVNRLACTESPLQDQVRSSDPSRDDRRSMCDVIFTSPGLTTSRGPGLYSGTGHGAAVVPVLLAASPCPAGQTVRGETVCAGPGGGLSFLRYLVVLARANLPGISVYTNGIYSNPAASRSRVFLLREPHESY